jgi:small conductance mechanosensitive channel
MTLPASPQPPAGPLDTLIAHLYGHFLFRDSALWMRILLICVLAVFVHVVVKGIRSFSEWVIIRGHPHRGTLGVAAQKPKVITVTRLVVSSVIFGIYFLAVGLVLREFGFSLTTYLASASVVGLAISFGSQGLVQDIVIGLTLIFWDAMDVGDLVEIAGLPTNNVIGRVQEIGMRFTKVVNFYNQVVFIPNRTIANVSRFPHGAIDAYADVQIPIGVEPLAAARAIGRIAEGMWSQFGAIILSDPAIGRVEAAQGGGWSFVRAHFKIWPGQGSLIEITFRQEVVKAMRANDPKYAEWQVAVTYRSAAVVRVLASK